jgi:hypothetical protein
MGPYNEGHIPTNVRRAVDAAELIVKMGGVPLVPHLNLTWEMHRPHNYGFWINYAFYLLEVSDAAYRLDGKSSFFNDTATTEIYTFQIPMFYEKTGPDQDGPVGMFEYITEWKEENDPSARHPAFRRSREVLLAGLGILE